LIPFTYSLMEITVLGTGTSQGVPVVACDCTVCQSTDTLDKRLRTSIMIRENNTCVVIDAGPDFRQQLLRENVKSLEAILITHSHRDHIGGLDDVRSFNWVQKRPMDVYATSDVQRIIENEYSYAFEEERYPGVPNIALKMVNSQPFDIKGLRFVPIKALHAQMQVMGYRLGEFSYLTDANQIHPEELEKMRGSKVIIINALRKKKHPSHFNLEDAINIIQSLAPQKAYLTHISHQMGLHVEIEKELPQNTHLAYDGLKISI